MVSAILVSAITGFALSTSYYLSLLLLFTAGVLNLTFSSMGRLSFNCCRRHSFVAASSACSPWPAWD